MEEYGEFICLDKETEEKLSKMNDAEISLFSFVIAESIRETQYKIMRKNGQINSKGR